MDQILPNFDLLPLEWTEMDILHTIYPMHRGLKFDGAIGQGKIFNSLKSEKFPKSFLSHIGKNKMKL